MPLDLSKVLFLPFQHCIYMFCEQKHTTELLRNCSKQSVLLRVNVRCLSVEIFSLRLFISFRLNGPFLQRLKELECSLKPMTHGWTNALTNKFTHIRAILQTHFWTLLNEDKDKLYSVTDRYSVTILQLLQTRVIENFWRSQKMAQLWVEHLSILSDNICKPRCFLICFYGVVFVARAITRKKIRTEAISIRLNSLPSYLGSLWWLRLNKSLGSVCFILPTALVECLENSFCGSQNYSFHRQLICCSCDQTENPTRTLPVPKRAVCDLRFIHRVSIYIEVTRKLPRLITPAKYFSYIYRHAVKSNHRSLLCTPSV